MSLDLALQVTLVHSGKRLIEFLGPKASEKSLKWLQDKKVEVILNDRYIMHYILKFYTRIFATDSQNLSGTFPKCC
jgi:hypothetical protein